MTNNIFIYNHHTGEAITREMTMEELSQWQIEEAERVAQKQLLEEKSAEAKALKIAVYEKLGLTAEEIQILLPDDKPIIANNG